MTEEYKAKLQALLRAYAERAANAQPTTPQDQADRRMCGERLRAVVRPVLDAIMAELKNAGHDAAVREHIERDDAYPSVALSFTPKRALASALMFKFDPRRGILVQRDIKQSPARGRVVTATTDRLGTIGVDAVSAPWVETKTLTFVEDVLKVN